MMSNYNILITGASGFIGQSLVYRLSKTNNKILAISRKKYEVEDNSNIEWVKCDIFDFQKIHQKVKDFKPEVVIHLLWEDIPNFNLENSLKNINNSINFFKFIFTLDTCKKILVSGSCLEYSKNKGVCIEDEIVIPNNYFTWAKHTLKNWLEIEALRCNFILGWFRIFYVYGPNQRKESLIPSLVNSFIHKKKITVNNIYNSNDFIFIDDVIDAFICFLNKKITSGTFNLGYGSPVSILDVCGHIEKIILNSNKQTKDLFKFNNEINYNKKSSFWANIEKSKDKLDWMPKHNIKDGLIKTINNI